MIAQDSRRPTRGDQAELPETVSTSEAARRADVTTRTIQNWCKRASVGGRAFGRKVGARWKVDREALDRHLSGEELDFGQQVVIGGRHVRKD